MSVNGMFDLECFHFPLIFSCFCMKLLCFRMSLQTSPTKTSTLTQYNSTSQATQLQCGDDKLNENLISEFLTSTETSSVHKESNSNEVEEPLSLSLLTQILHDVEGEASNVQIRDECSRKVENETRPKQQKSVTFLLPPPTRNPTRKKLGFVTRSSSQHYGSKPHKLYLNGHGVNPLLLGNLYQVLTR